VPGGKRLGTGRGVVPVGLDDAEFVHLSPRVDFSLGAAHKVVCFVQSRETAAMPAARSIRLPERVDRRALVALVVLTGAILVVLVGASRARPGTVTRRLSDEEREKIGNALAALEPSWAERAAEAFPGDVWSQEDDFARIEHEQAQAQARKYGASMGDVLRAIDESLRIRSAGRRVGVSPCKPRPFYD
jgi:hypothetical protein